MESKYKETVISKNAEKLSKQYNLTSLIINLTGIAVGIAIIIVGRMITEDKNSTQHLFMVTTGIIILSAFILKMFIGGKHLVYKATGSTVKKYSVFFKAEYMDELIRAIEAENFAELNRLAGKANAGLRLDTLISDDSHFASCQVFQYIPHNYQAASDVYNISEKNSAAFCSFIKELYLVQSK